MPAYRYKGPDTFFSVPARDLTEAEFDALPPKSRRDVRNSAAYVESTAKELTQPKAEAKPAAKAADKKEGE